LIYVLSYRVTNVLTQTESVFLLRAQNRSCLGVGTSGSREDVGKGCRRVNMVHVHVHVNEKMRPAETIPGMGGGGIKRMMKGVNSTDIVNILEEHL
jgi:hypothetical protein